MKLYVYTGAQGPRVHGKRQRRSQHARTIDQIIRTLSTSEHMVSRGEATDILRSVQRNTARRSESERRDDLITLTAEREARLLRAKPERKLTEPLSRAERRIKRANTCSCTLTHTCDMHKE